MPTEFSCPECGLRYKVADEHRGRAAKCKNGHPFILGGSDMYIATLCSACGAVYALPRTQPTHQVKCKCGQLVSITASQTDDTATDDGSDENQDAEEHPSWWWVLLSMGIMLAGLGIAGFVIGQQPHRNAHRDEAMLVTQGSYLLLIAGFLWGLPAIIAGLSRRVPEHWLLRMVLFEFQYKRIRTAKSFALLSIGRIVLIAAVWSIAYDMVA